MTKLIETWKQKSFLQKFFVIFIILSATLWVIVPSTYHSTLHFDPAETLMWGSTFNWGCAKHPPVSGYMLYHFCALFGFPNYAIFLLSQICVTIGFIYIYKLARCFFDRDHSVIATLLITFYFFYNFETPKFNANLPHLLFIPMMCYYFYRGTVANKWHHWLLLAFCAAAACLSKYSAGVLFVSFVLFLLIDKNARRSLTTIKPYAAALFFCLLMTPHIIHLFKTDFLVFNYISHGKKIKYGYFMQLVVLAAALAAPLLSMIFFCALSHFSGEKKLPSFKNIKLKITNLPAAKYSICLVGGQAAFLLLMGLAGHRLLTIWTYPLFLTAGILIVSFYPVPVSERTSRCFAILAAIFGAVMLIIPLINYNVSTKYRYHIAKSDFRRPAEEFYRRETGKNIPFIIGDIWHAAMLQNTFKYRIKACPDSDPILINIHRDTLASRGALVIASNKENSEKELKKHFDISRLKWHDAKIPYRARFGKEKIYTISLAVLPPAAVKAVKAEKTK